MAQSIERWGLFELKLSGPDTGNPFVDITLEASFKQQDRSVQVKGFYDGQGQYLLRFMPDTEGEWHYETSSNAASLSGKTGSFICTPAQEGNHGPVYVHNTYHFAYADGTPYYPFGTTCYAWTHQGDAMEERTLATLKETAFNKIRMCVFPKHYPFNHNEPEFYAFERDADGNNDYSRFEPQFWHHLEKRIQDLQDLGIEADIIIWHPYDRWGYATMDEQSDFFYLRYLIARIAAFRNVWWSLANEYDFMLEDKPMERWDNFFRILAEEDPYAHLRSIHNGDVNMYYDHNKPEVSHVCIQDTALRKVKDWREQYHKPIVNDELQYEGDVPHTWGCISAEEEVHRFWIMVANGGYAGHGETYMDEHDTLWWGKGGVLRGESWKRIGFLRQIIEAAPAGGLNPILDAEESLFSGRYGRRFKQQFAGGFQGNYHLVYLGVYQPKVHLLPETVAGYQVEVIDTWNMTISEPITPFKLVGPEQQSYLYDDRGEEQGYAIELPGKPYLALRFSKP